MKFDRLANIAFVILMFAAAAIGQDLPKPEIHLVGVTDEVNNGHAVRVYEIEVVNRYEFDNALFVAAPVLPPCGRTANASRTWLNIYRDKSVRFYGWCGINANNELASLKFILPADREQPKKIFIDFVDRAEGKFVRSNKLTIE